MIETNFDNCVEPLKFFSWDRERALLKMGARRALINVEGQPNLSNLIITFRGPFTVSVCLMIILFI